MAETLRHVSLFTAVEAVGSKVLVSLGSVKAIS